MAFRVIFSGVMNKRLVAFAVVFLVLLSIVIVGILFIHLGMIEGSTGKLYTFPLSVEEQTYMVSVSSNYTSAPEVSYSGLFKMVSVDFRGDPEIAFCNIIIPTNLIWGKLSVYAKGYKMSEADYIQSNNSTHNSVYFTFNHIALVKTFDVMGTEGVKTVP